MLARERGKTRDKPFLYVQSNKIWIQDTAKVSSFIESTSPFDQVRALLPVFSRYCFRILKTCKFITSGKSIYYPFLLTILYFLIPFKSYLVDLFIYFYRCVHISLFTLLFLVLFLNINPQASSSSTSISSSMPSV